MQDIRVWTTKSDYCSNRCCYSRYRNTYNRQYGLYSSQKVFRVQAGVGCVYCPDRRYLDYHYDCKTSVQILHRGCSALRRHGAEPTEQTPEQLDWNLLAAVSEIPYWGCGLNKNCGHVRDMIDFLVRPQPQIRHRAQWILVHCMQPSSRHRAVRSVCYIVLQHLTVFRTNETDSRTTQFKWWRVLQCVAAC